MDDYEQYEKDKEKNIKRNKKFLNEFKTYMQNQKLSPKTIKKHLSNINFYLNEYLTYYDVTKMEDGVYEINMFLGVLKFLSENVYGQMHTRLKKMPQV